jgi:thioredoxin 1
MGANSSSASVNNEQDLIEKLRSADRVIALFYASWCPFCERFLPIFQKHAAQEGRHFVLVQDDEETIAGRYSIEIYPTVLFFENGTVSKRLDGVPGVGLSEKHLTEFVGLCPMS